MCASIYNIKLNLKVKKEKGDFVQESQFFLLDKTNNLFKLNPIFCCSRINYQKILISVFNKNKMLVIIQLQVCLVFQAFMAFLF